MRDFRAQFLGSPRPETLKRLISIFNKEAFTARIAPLWPGSPRNVVLVLLERPAPQHQIQLWSKDDGEWTAPLAYLRRTTKPQPRDAGFVQQAVIDYFNTQPDAERVWTWDDHPVWMRERARKWKGFD